MRLRMDMKKMMAMKRRVLSLATVTLAAALLAACATTQQSVVHSPKTGTVVGNFTLSVGLTVPHPTGGTLTFMDQSAHRSAVRIAVGHSGHFSARILPGTWIVTGSSPHFGDGCGGQTITVTAGKRTATTVYCVGK
jgi:hypothetical protein